MKSPKNVISDLNTITGRLRHARGALHLSQKDISVLAAIPKRTLENYENGISSPSTEYLSFLATKYGFNINWILTGQGDMFISSTSTNGSVVPEVSASSDIDLDLGLGDTAGSKMIDLAASSSARSSTSDGHLDAPSEVATAGWTVTDALIMASRVFESGTSYANALYLNVVHFDRAIQAEARINRMERAQADALGAFRTELDTLRNSMEKRISELERECAELRQENATLKSTGPVEETVIEIPAPGAGRIPQTRSTGRKHT